MLGLVVPRYISILISIDLQALVQLWPVLCCVESVCEHAVWFYHKRYGPRQVEQLSETLSFMRIVDDVYIIIYACWVHFNMLMQTGKLSDY